MLDRVGDIRALDLHEHAYHRDFAGDAAAYIAAYLENLHWGRPGARLQAAVTPAAAAARPDPHGPISPEELRDLLTGDACPLLLDVCLAEDRPKRRDKLPGADFHLAEEMADWIGTLPRERPIVAYCLYGYQVSGNAVAELRRRGFDARQLAGGIAGWHAMAGPTEPFA